MEDMNGAIVHILHDNHDSAPFMEDVKVVPFISSTRAARPRRMGAQLLLAAALARALPVQTAAQTVRHALHLGIAR